MRDRLTIVFGILVLLPVVVLAVFGAKIARDARTMVAERTENLREDRLLALAADVRRTVEAVETELGAAMDATAPDDAEALRELVRHQPLVAQVFVLDPRGQLQFPRDAEATESERSFLTRTQAIWKGHAILYQPPAEEKAPLLLERGSSSPSRKSGGESVSGLARGRAQGWITWYWAEGLHLLFWRARDGQVMGVEVDRVGLLSRIVGQLPELDGVDGRVALMDSRGDTVFQWGGAEPVKGERPAAKRALDYPLESFGFADHPTPNQTLTDATQLAMYASLAAVIVAMLVLGAYFHRERTREMREARQRVTFVTQVSHELKTPLTNIRLYAELMADEVEEESPAARHLGVIVSESQRLSRLIHNILTFSKHTNGRLELRPSEVAMPSLVEGVLAQFEPSFAAKGLVAKVSGDAPERITADPDAVGQILGNLLSNVEKYAADGKSVEIELGQDAEITRIAVRDRGPGIPTAQSERVFEAFVRLGDRLSDGAGTGIGLTIARELARLHGGELSVETVQPGARFVLSLPRRELRGSTA